MLVSQPCQHDCRCIANGGALKSVAAPYNGVIREASENPGRRPQGFWAGTARHYRPQGSANDAQRLSHPTRTEYQAERLRGAQLDFVPGTLMETNGDLARDRGDRVGRRRRKRRWVPGPVRLTRPMHNRYRLTRWPPSIRLSVASMGSRIGCWTRSGVRGDALHTIGHR